jgi:mono/diheme cytochrome c family protein
MSIVMLLWGALIWSGCSHKEPPRAEPPSDPGAQQAENQTRGDEATENTGEQAATVETALNYEQSNGKVLYARYCSVCHGESGKGDGFNAYNLQPAAPRNFTDTEWISHTTDDQLFEVIAKGGGETGHSVLMPAWGKTLTQREIRYIVSYLHSLATSLEGRIDLQSKNARKPDKPPRGEG